jgi:hypothetical protein
LSLKRWGCRALGAIRRTLYFLLWEPLCVYSENHFWIGMYLLSICHVCEGHWILTSRRSYLMPQ